MSNSACFFGRMNFGPNDIIILTSLGIGVVVRIMTASSIRWIFPFVILRMFSSAFVVGGLDSSRCSLLRFDLRLLMFIWWLMSASSSWEYAFSYVFLNVFICFWWRVGLSLDILSMWFVVLRVRSGVVPLKWCLIRVIRSFLSALVLLSITSWFAHVYLFLCGCFFGVRR